MTLNDVWPAFVKHKRNYVKPSTLSAYIHLWAKISSWFGLLDINAISTKEVEKWCIDQLHTLSKKSVEDRITLVNNILDFAAYEYEVPVTRIVRKHIRWPKKKELPSMTGDEYIYRADELRRIVEYVSKNPLPTNILVAIMIATGIRIGEAAALTYDDVDEKLGVVSICKTIERIQLDPKVDILNETILADHGIKILSRTKNTAVICSTPKSRAGIRVVPLPKSLLKVLKGFKAVYPGHYYISSNTPMPVEPAIIRRRYRSLVLNDVGLERYLKPHALRHTFASMLVTSKVDVRTVAEILGHSDVSTTLTVYSHASVESKRRAIGTTIGKRFDIM